MPTLPTVSALTANSVGILNTIRDNASAEYYAAVPAADATTASIRSVGNIIMGHQSTRNEFIDTLINRIAMVIVTSRAYANPLAVFKRGFIEMGESVEEIFVQLAKAHPFDAEKAEAEVFKREIPEVKTMFHMMNIKAFYKQTISNDQLKQAFLSLNGMTDFVGQIVRAMYSALAYDEYIMTKYMVGLLALNGSIAALQVSDFSVAANANGIVTNIKTISNNMEFMRNDYNIAGVNNSVDKADQYLLQTTAFSANIDVNALAQAFNLPYVEFAGRQIMVDSFALNANEMVRLATLLEKDTSYVPFTTEQNAVLATIGALLVDKNFFMVFDNLQEANSIYNTQGLYYNQTLHVWKTFSASPFADAVLFSTLASAIDSVTVTPATASLEKGSLTQFSAAVATTGFANRGVTWAMTGNATSGASGSYVDATTGLVKIGAAETAVTITVTATSIADATEADAATVTVEGNA